MLWRSWCLTWSSSPSTLVTSGRWAGKTTIFKSGFCPAAKKVKVIKPTTRLALMIKYLTSIRMKTGAEAFTQYIYCGRPSLIRRRWRSSRGHTYLKLWTVSINQLKLFNQVTLKKTIKVIIRWCLVSSRISRALPTWNVVAKRGNEAIACSRLLARKAPTSLATGSKKDIV